MTLSTPEPHHIVQFYEDEEFLYDAVARFLSAGLSVGEPLVVIATEPHRQGFCQRLKSNGFDIEGACRAGQLTLLDAAETLTHFMVGSMPDWELFHALMGRVLAKSPDGVPPQRVRAYGEMVDLLWRGGNPQAAIRLEEFWNELGRTRSFSLLCTYLLGGFYKEAHGEQFRQVCSTHTHVIPAESYPQSGDSDARLREVSILQQRARALETELKHRRELEEALRNTLSELRQSQWELKDFVENAAEGLHWVGSDGVILWANKAELELLGYSRDEYIGRHIAEFHADREIIQDMLARLARNETLRDYEARLRCKDGSIKHVLINSNVLWEDGQFRHTRCFTRDNTARKHAHDALLRLQAERTRFYEAESRSRKQAEAAQRRTALLSDASALLSSSLDYETTLTSVARLVVSRVADWCVVELASDSSPPSTPIVMEHADASKLQAAREYRLRCPPDPNAVRGVAHVIQSGKSELSPDSASLIVPMTARGRTLGAIVLMTASTERRFELADLEMAEDLGRRAALAIDNARLYSDARQANRRKDEFLAMLGHELRNPLAPILTALQLMQLRGVGADREQKVIERQVRHLMRLVEDLLDISRITRGKVELRKEPVELATVLAKAIEMVSPLYEQRSHRLVVDVQREGLLIDADPVRLAQVLANLLSNAAKYTEPGGQVVVAARRDAGELVVSVKDNGVGIPPEMLSKVFELFVQGERALDRAQGGLGIGLSLARSLAELHGGTISAQSPGLGMGSEFTVCLPALAKQAVPEQAPAGKAQFTAEVPHSGVRVLLVDDNKDAADLLAEALRGFGHEVAVAHDGPQALSLAPSFQPNTALLDIGLPVMDGYELAKKLREMTAGRPLRLLALTGYGQDTDRSKSQDAGFDVHLVKPVDLDAIATLLAETAGSQRQST